ncbi:hypothetical protein D7X55_31975 [Corallococcus sp. AB049A]|uniref:hypothetical protein n=1 Tax=Corallococcus sp. AB049A TaxID=2316721 RepID=UPI000EBC1A35|nr:hypothetical protein [Corallococcus sp. AB049A]RKI52793.1 hypothetical protein D7X55_31975 [Corallococcus sp. AB049A]
MKLDGTVAMFVLALGATGAMAHNREVKSHDPRMAVSMEEVVQVSKTGPLVVEVGYAFCVWPLLREALATWARAAVMMPFTALDVTA